MNTINNNTKLNFNAKLRVDDPQRLVPEVVVKAYTGIAKNLGQNTDEIFIRALEDNSKKSSLNAEVLEGNVKIDEKVVKSFGERVTSWGDRVTTMQRNFAKLFSEKITPAFEKNK